MYGLDLFSGIGGLTKALEPWVRPIAYCENERYAQAVLLSRMADGTLPPASIWTDVRTLALIDLLDLPKIEIIYGGFPCQDISVAGRGEGLGGERSGLFFEVVRLVGEIRPTFIFLENVPAIRTRGADVVAGEMARLRYDCRFDVVSARECGSPIEEGWRWFLLAKAIGGRQRSIAYVPEAVQKRPRIPRQKREEIGVVFDTDMRGKVWCFPDSCPDRTIDALPIWMEQVRALGNAVVPLQAQKAFKRLCGLK